jgi:hypothetical protein
VTISQPPGPGRGKSGGQSGAKPGSSGDGGASGRKPPPGRKPPQPAQRSGSGRPPVSQKTAGNRTVTAKGVKQSGTRQGGKTAAPSSNGRGASKTPVGVGRKPSPKVLGIVGIGLVVVIVAVLVIAGVSHKVKPPATYNLTPIAPASLVSQVTNVPESVATAVGYPSEVSNFPTKLKGQKPLTNSGLPEMLYMGAEYCPFCAAERWSMIMALSKFGTFTGLKTTFSSTSDFAPDTATFTFSSATYTSKYLAFKPFELATNQQAASSTACNVNGYACLDTNYTNAEYSLFQNLGPATSRGSFPFMDFGNKLLQSGAGFEDQPLALAGLTADQVASQLYNPKGAVAQAEIGSANYLTAALCVMTGDQPASVCSTPFVKQGEKKEGF